MSYQFTTLQGTDSHTYVYFRQRLVLVSNLFVYDRQQMGFAWNINMITVKNGNKLEVFFKLCSSPRSRLTQDTSRQTDGPISVLARLLVLHAFFESGKCGTTGKVESSKVIPGMISRKKHSNEAFVTIRYSVLICQLF